MTALNLAPTEMTANVFAADCYSFEEQAALGAGSGRLTSTGATDRSAIARRTECLADENNASDTRALAAPAHSVASRGPFGKVAVGVVDFAGNVPGVRTILYRTIL